MSNTSSKKKKTTQKKAPTKKCSSRCPNKKTALKKTPSSDAPVENYITEAITNIRTDRAVTSTLLMELMVHMKHEGTHSHEKLGLIASKYVETLQRSNEQLVKVTSLLQKKDGKSSSLSPLEKEEIFDLLNKNGG